MKACLFSQSNLMTNRSKVQAKEEDKNQIKKAEYILHPTKKKILKCLKILKDYQA